MGMPPTDDQDLSPRPREPDGDDDLGYGGGEVRRSSLESRALRHQLDRLRTLQQKNDVLSGDKLLTTRQQQEEKPHNVKNYYRWLRGVAEGDPAALQRASSPVPYSRPRSRSLQLDAKDVSMLTRLSTDSDRSRSPSDPAVNAITKTRLPLGSLNPQNSSDEEPNHASPPRSASPQRVVKGNVHKQTLSGRQSPRKSNVVSKPMCHPKQAAANTERHKLNRGIVIKPKTGPSNRRQLSPVKRERRKSLDINADADMQEVRKHVEQVQTLNTPSNSSAILPNISTTDIGYCDKNFSKNVSVNMDIKRPMSILKKIGSPHQGHLKSVSAPYAVKVTFDDNPTLIPATCPSGRRASIAEDTNFFKEQGTINNDKINERSCPPPPPFQPWGNNNPKLSWLAPGTLPNRRRNSLPPLSVSLSEIQAVGNDEDDDVLFTNLSNRGSKISIELFDENKKSPETQPLSSGIHSEIKNDTEESDLSGDDHEEVLQISPPLSCFSVPSVKSHIVDVVDSNCEVRCDVVHSFTPRPKLRNNALSQNTGTYCDPL